MDSDAELRYLHALQDIRTTVDDARYTDVAKLGIIALILGSIYIPDEDPSTQPSRATH